MSATIVEKVARLGLGRDAGFAYFIDGEGSVCRKAIDPHLAAREVLTVLAPHAVVREPGYLYFIDVDGDVSRQREDHVPLVSVEARTWLLVHQSHRTLADFLTFGVADLTEAIAIVDELYRLGAEDIELCAWPVEDPRMQRNTMSLDLPGDATQRSMILRFFGKTETVGNPILRLHMVRTR